MDQKQKPVPLATLDTMDRLGMERTDGESPSGEQIVVEEPSCLNCMIPYKKCVQLDMAGTRSIDNPSLFCCPFWRSPKIDELPTKVRGE